MNQSGLTDLVKSGDIDTVIVASPDMQGRPFAKRMTGRHFVETGGTVGTCSVVLGWGHDHSLDAGYELTGWDNGYPDLSVVPDMNTLREYPWFERTAFVIADAVTPAGAEIHVAPRSILKTAIAKLAERGLNAAFASELEFFLLNETPTSAFDKGFVNLETRHRTLHPESLLRMSEDEAFLGPLRANLETAGVPVEMIKAEFAPGQVELNLKYTDALAAADRHFLMKIGTKEQALQQGVVATFMPKLSHNMGGSSCHLHMSLMNEAGDNVFASTGDPAATTDTMRHFLGGMTQYIRDIFLFFAPTTNAYRRMQPGTFAPATVTWGEDNRTVALRIVGKGPARRIENRIPGADVNPYLAYSAMILAGIRGIEEKLEPAGEAATGNAYSIPNAPILPASLDEATTAFETSSFIKDAFGSTIQKHYANFGRQSVRAAAPIVTDYERRMFLLDI